MNEKNSLKRGGVLILIVRILIGVLIVGGLAGSVYFYQQYQALKKDSNVNAKVEADQLISQISKFMDLPTDEAPTIATVLDKSKLTDQVFFKNAENGDKLLAYTKAKKAILYRPSTNKIIEVAPIFINQQEGVSPTEQPNAQVSITPEALSLRIAYMNGTETVGLSGQAEKIVKTTYTNYQTVDISNASQKNYKANLVVDLSGKYQKEVNELAQLLGGKVSLLPEGEIRPDADILIISGK